MNNIPLAIKTVKEELPKKNNGKPPKQFYQTIWISDVHLGFKDCKAKFLKNFLQSSHCETLYLVGDIIDLWSMKKQFFWADSHYQVLKEFQKKIEQGTKVIYIPGNHDNTLREYISSTIMGIEIHENYIHRAKDGKRYLLMHGDEFDHATRYNQLISLIGDKAYDLLLFLNRLNYVIRRLTGNHYWSLASWLKNRVHKAREAILAFENAAIHEARRQGVDGIICGHIHQPEIRIENNITYCNDGDWVENCTALVENTEGHIELIHWSDISKKIKSNKKKTPVNR